jgi:hypothetical protein
LSTYLRRTHRDVKAASIKALFAIVGKFPTDISQPKVNNLVDNLSAVLTSDDNQLYSSVMDVLTLLIQNCNPSPEQMNSTLAPTIVGLFDRQAAQTQGAAWSSYGNCLAALSRKGLSAPIYSGLLADGDWDNGVLAANAKAIATILAFSDHSEWTVWKAPVDGSLERKLLRLMVIGEGGKLMY